MLISSGSEESQMKKHERPALLGKNMDNHLQQIMTAMHSQWGFLND